MKAGLKINAFYHLVWANEKALFKLVAIINSENGIVYTGKTNGKYLDIKLSDLRHVKDYQLNNID